MIGTLLIQWTIRLSLVFYVAALGCLLAPRASSGRQPLARLCWTAGALFFVAHVICAFHFYHHWSHWHAFDHTAAETQRLISWRFGAGIYFSYLFTLLWVLDALWWWLHPTSYAGRKWPVAYLIHAYIFFIAFNGAVIFESGPTRWGGIAATIALAVWMIGRAVSYFVMQPSRLQETGESPTPP